jgi:hypothetical protein
MNESAKERARLIREEELAVVSDDPWLKELTEEHWPFDDCNEDGEGIERVQQAANILASLCEQYLTCKL